MLQWFDCWMAPLLPTVEGKQQAGGVNNDMQRVVCGWLHGCRVASTMLTCHEAMHMEEGHDHQGPVLWPQLIRGNDVGKAGRQVALAQWHTLHKPKAPLSSVCTPLANNRDDLQTV